MYQDHQAHIAVHIAASQDPKIMGLIQQSPMAKVIGAALQAHIAEHMAFEYRRQIEEAAGVPYPDPEAKMDEATELEISRLAAAAADQVLNKHQSEAAQQQAMQAMQDPVMQIQQAELQIKQAEAQLKAQKLQVEAAEKADKLDLERERLASQERIAGMQTGAKIAQDKAKMSFEEQKAGIEMGIDIAREAAQEDREMRNQMQQTQQTQQTQQPEGEQ